MVVRRRARVVRIRPAGNTGHLLATRRRAGTAERLTDAARAAESWSQANQMFSFITLLGSDYDVWAFSLNDTEGKPCSVSKVAPSLSSFPPASLKKAVPTLTTILLSRAVVRQGLAGLIGAEIGCPARKTVVHSW